MTNLIYTLVQIVHNFGAAAIVCSALVAFWLGRGNTVIQRRLAWLLVFGALAQISSGLGFGLTSYFLKGELPEIEGIAFIALMIKIFCVITSPAIIIRFVLGNRQSQHSTVWFVAIILGSTALIAAAFLRWYM